MIEVWVQFELLNWGSMTIPYLYSLVQRNISEAALKILIVG